MLKNKLTVYILSIFLLAITSPSQSAVFHVLKGKVCVGLNDLCKGSRNQCHSQGEIFNLKKNETLVALVDSELGFQNRLGQTTYKVIQKSCTPKSAVEFNATPAKPETLFETAEMLSTGQKEMVQGGKRLKPGMSFLASMPRGDVLLPARAITFDLRELSPNKILKLQVTNSESNKILIDISRPSESIALAANHLHPEGIYKWTIRTSDKTFQGMFRVMDSVYQKEVESEVQVVLKSSQASPMGQNMMRAAIYHEYGLTFDRDRMLDEVRKMNERR